MTQSKLIQSLMQLWHADGLMLDLKARRLGFRIVVISFAVLVASVSVMTAAIGIYVALSDLLGGASAAAILSASSMLLAMVLLASALHGPYATQLKHAERAHDQALDLLKREMHRFDISDPRDAGPLVETLLPLITPIVSALVVEGLRRHRGLGVPAAETRTHENAAS